MSEPTTTKPKPIHPALLAHVKVGQSDPSNVLRCSAARCATEIDLGKDTTPEQKARYAAVHGFVECAGKQYCSKRCCMIAQTQTPADQNPQAAPNGLTSVALAKPATAAEIDGSRIRVTATSANHDTIYWAHCGYTECQTKIEISPGSDDVAARAKRTCQAHGFIETPAGVYCGKTCARRHAVDVANKVHRGSHVAPPTDYQKAREATFDRYKARVQKGGAELLMMTGNDRRVALQHENRIAAFEGDTFESACAGALDHLGKFLGGEIGITMSPFASVEPLRVGPIAG